MRPVPHPVRIFVCRGTRDQRACRWLCGGLPKVRDGMRLDGWWCRGTVLRTPSTSPATPANRDARAMRTKSIRPSSHNTVADEGISMC